MYLRKFLRWITQVTETSFACIWWDNTSLKSQPNFPCLISGCPLFNYVFESHQAIPFPDHAQAFTLLCSCHVVYIAYISVCPHAISEGPARNMEATLGIMIKGFWIEIGLYVLSRSEKARRGCWSNPDISVGSYSTGAQRTKWWRLGTSEPRSYRERPMESCWNSGTWAEEPCGARLRYSTAPATTP